MTDPRNFRLRCVFVEQGRLALLSHREMANTLERTVRRAKLPYAISQGFSPHMKLAFGAALPVGVGSTCEIFDVQLTDYVAPAKALAALQAASVPDLMVQSCTYIEHTAPAASVAYPFSTYRVDFAEPVDAAAWSAAVPAEITLARASKPSKGKGKKKPDKVLVVAEFLSEPFAFAADGLSATFTLEAKPTGSLRPDVLVRACADACGVQVVALTRIAQS